ncbi:MAG: SPFH/Band 7/PHB domain protein [Candidatus Bathyarchaeota archaeon]|nr:SPFH/Band 7/PHB domain protein [Candidatus Bathyarchaeota archaeon]
MIALVGLTEFEIELAVIALVVVVGVIALAVSGVKIVGQYERGLIESWGAYSKTAGPGLKFIVPIQQKIYRVNMREQVIDVPPQEIITEDNVVVNVDAVVYYQIMDPKRAIYEIEDFEMAIVKLAQTTLRNVVGEMTLDTCLTSREKINIDLRKVLDEATDKWGTKVNRIEVQRIDPPKDIQEAMHKQKTAEQERRQARLQATGRKEAAEQDKEGTILVAEGRSQSILLVAEAEAKAIKLVSEAANEYFKENAQINKKLEVIRDTFSNQTKIIVPSNSDVLNILGLEGGQILPIKKTGGEAAKQ